MRGERRAGDPRNMGLQPRPGRGYHRGMNRERLRRARQDITGLAGDRLDWVSFARAAGDVLCAKVTTFLREHVDPLEIDRTETIPRQVLRGLLRQLLIIEGIGKKLFVSGGILNKTVHHASTSFSLATQR